MVHEIAQSMHISFTQVGFLSSAMFYSYLVLQGPSGAIAQLIGSRLSLIIAAIGISLSCLLFAYGNNYYLAVAGRLLAGVFAAPCVVSCLLLGSRWLPLRWFASLCGVVEMMGMLGAAAGPVIVSISLEYMSWQQTFLIISFIGLILVLIVLIFVKNRPYKPIANTEEKLCPHKAHAVKTSAFKGLTLLIKTKGFISSCLFGFFSFAILNSFGGLWLTPFIKSIYPLSSHSAGAFTTFIFVGAATGIMLFSFFTEYISTKILMFSGALCCLVTLAIMLFIPLPSALMRVLTFVLGIASGVYVIPFALVKQKVPENLTGMALGITNGIIIGSGLIFQPLIGYLLSINIRHHYLTVFNYQLAFLPLITGLIISLLLTLKVKDLRSIRTDRYEKLKSEKKASA